VAEAMLKAGADATRSDSLGITPLSCICTACDDKTAAQLARVASVGCESYEAYLSKIVKTCKIELLKVIVAAGTVLNIYNHDGLYPIMYACMHESGNELVNVLLEGTIDLSYGDFKGRTPLFYAVDSNKVDIVQAMLNADADATDTDKDGQTILMGASNEVCETVIQHLRKKYNIVDMIGEVEEDDDDDDQNVTKEEIDHNVISIVINVN
jgi:ankyrin repeat protein